MKTPLQPTWDLDVLFTGGSESAEFKQYLDNIKEQIARFRQLGLETKAPAAVEEAAESLRPRVELLQSISIMLSESSAFTSCLAAQDQRDKKAVQLGAVVTSLKAEFLSAVTGLDQWLLQIPDAIWTELLTMEEWAPIAFGLEERRNQAKEKLSPQLEALIQDLSVDGYHGWSRAYDTAVSQVRIVHEEGGQQHELSAGQAFNKLHQSDRDSRQALFAKWEEAWQEKADFCADALNHLAGFRLQVYKHRQWSSIHKEPLAINRMSEETLTAMWDVIERNKAPFVEYLQRKAERLSIDQLEWHDVDAPSSKTQKTYSYDEAAALIVEQFAKFSPQMADFAVHAFENRWIEAEDRANKRPGGFCSSFPASGQTRIFMTYAGTADNVSTLAHELGHGFHQHVMKDLPALSQKYAMNVAETASTFAEMIVSEAAVRQAASPDERLALLEDKIQRSVAFFMNIHARFLFETRFYEERVRGPLSVDRLNELMITAQKEAYCNALGSYHPHFWASKLHFYITGVPFYNFPYTFGYLFSAGIYSAAIQEGKSFENRYIALLQDTGRMNVEDLAHKHLGVDLRQPEFWQQALDLSVQDVRQFLELTK
ncbi:M3 family oligoendopeptidase [Paenibacillus senegalensis]|uniref:M3 family oligoendopeptidase n=1 Tax=Paenibacillus senegalensis TaxID=1465766 RepID=UPI00028914E4|nr:M3 family oligoendopeptidase [Paenibacillus senegalensis]